MSTQRPRDAVRVQTLSPERRAVLAAAGLTYSDVGSSLRPGQANMVSWSAELGRGPAVFDTAAAAVLSWQAQAGAGLIVRSSTPEVHVGTLVDLTLGVQLGGRAVGVRAPCRVVIVRDEPDEKGFAYGTLPGHPEVGEESFLVRRAPDGEVTFTVSAVAGISSWVLRLGAPVVRLVRAAVVKRYLRAVQAAVRDDAA